MKLPHTSSSGKPVLTVQVDVDTSAHLLSFYGFHVPPGYQDSVTYRLAVPRFAELFQALGLRATFFVVGKDLDSAGNQDAVRRLHAAGHEIANHTQTHPYKFVHVSLQQKRDEIERAGQAVEKVTGQKPVGFRAPGYDVDRTVMEILIGLGYKYDSSVMPSFVNLPLKLYQMLKSRNWTFSGYGSLALALSPNRPYRPDVRAIWRSAAAQALWEIPVSCVPFLRLPFYANFNLYTGDTVFDLSSALMAGKNCNYVFHAVEMLDPSEIDPRIHRHPNALLSLAEKTSRCRRFLERLSRGRRVLATREFVAELQGTGSIEEGKETALPSSQGAERPTQK